MRPAEKNKIPERNVPQEDWFLQILVNMANRATFGFGITLNVGGFLISGTLISGKQYFEGIGGDFSSVIKEKKAAQELKDAFAKYGDIYDEDPVHNDPPAYIHVKDVTFFNTAGKPLPGNRGIWWRGRISEVQGFMLGRLNQAESSPESG